MMSCEQERDVFKKSDRSAAKQSDDVSQTITKVCLWEPNHKIKLKDCRSLTNCSVRLSFSADVSLTITQLRRDLSLASLSGRSKKSLSRGRQRWDVLDTANCCGSFWSTRRSVAEELICDWMQRRVFGKSSWWSLQFDGRGWSKFCDVTTEFLVNRWCKEQLSKSTVTSCHRQMESAAVGNDL